LVGWTDCTSPAVWMLQNNKNASAKIRLEFGPISGGT
jgi:hypothetical protein